MRLTDSTGRIVSQAYAPWPILGGGSGAGPAPDPLPGPSSPLMAVDLPSANAVATQPFAVAGWAIDAGASANSGIDTVHVWAYPNPGSNAPARFIGAAAYGGARGDIAAAFGARFLNSGFGLTVSGLPPGVYQFVAFAHSRLTGTFNNSQAVVVTIPSNPPRMSVDFPASNQATGSTVFVAGWAFDPNTASGSGVDTVHVWTYPNPGSGAAPRFLGVGTVGGSRPDVAAAFGPWGALSGYSLHVTGLSPGVHDIVVFAHSSVTGTFNNSQVVRITVR
jgi:hypothetical protein